MWEAFLLELEKNMGGMFFNGIGKKYVGGKAVHH